MSRAPAAAVDGGPDGGRDVVRLRGLVRELGGRRVLDGLDLTIAAGEFTALLGRSGSGKSTLLRTLAGLDPAPAEGTVLPALVGTAFQEPRLLPWEPVWRNVVLGAGPRASRELARSALAEVGLEHLADAWPLSLSGGEAQRVSLARALVRGPDLLLLDEPFSALDALTRRSVHALVRDLHARHRPAVLLVTHDVAEAVALADRVLVLDGGRTTAERRVTPAVRGDDAAAAALVRDLLGALGVPAGPV
ncbi:ABC transporter ATP-binding protein [Kineococcus sp. SYSU DK004]|uniref:ABC transporter ATP-binding protein n=1 Tax=Kineococcus sp. SYSU DK004 TaxID=3383125 RepID=UPI003D7CC005